jgi:uracil-DNA glycosylase family 4
VEDAGRPGSAARDLGALEAEVVACRACQRLVEWRERVGRAKRPAYADQTYWSRPVPGFGDPAAWLLVVGLAPGAHGSNRTGRMFTGDRSGEWLYRALYRAGLANRPTATNSTDGLALAGAFITAIVRCAPPDNKPSPSECANCRPFLERELDALGSIRVMVALGAFAWRHLLRVLKERGMPVPSPLPRFGHLAEADLGSVQVLGSYHPSQQNTFTGKLTEPMFHAVWDRATELLAAAGNGQRSRTGG